MRRKAILRVLSFFLFLLILLFSIIQIQSVFTIDYAKCHEHLKDFGLEKKGSIDAVYIGGSDVHSFWSPLLGWKYYGITVWNYSVDSIPVKCIKNLLVEARKTQPDALYIFNISTFKKDSTQSDMASIHRAIDLLPLSFNKIDCIRRLTTKDNYTSLEDAIEYAFPIIRFHSRWDSLNHFSYEIKDRDYKSSLHVSEFYSLVEDVSDIIEVYNDYSRVPEDVMSTFIELLEYCSKEKVKVLFVKVPQAADRDQQGRMNELEEIATARGFNVVDLLEKYETLAIDLHSDFYNFMHTNIHGAIKITRYLGDYLVKHYSFKDKRGLEGWESWDQASEQYHKELSRYIFPFEGVTKRSNIPSPTNIKIISDEDKTTISWNNEEDADYYEIYGYCDDRWDYIGKTDQNTFQDDIVLSHTLYTVVPIKNINGEKYYGHFDVKGVSSTAGGTK